MIKQETENDKNIDDLLNSIFSYLNLNDSNLKKLISICENSDVTQKKNIEKKLSNINYKLYGPYIQDYAKFILNVYDKLTQSKTHNILYRSLVKIAVQIEDEEVFNKYSEKIMASIDEINNLFSNNSFDEIIKEFTQFIKKLKIFKINFFDTEKAKLFISQLLFHSFCKHNRDCCQTEQSGYIKDVLNFLYFLSYSIKPLNIYKNIIQQLISERDQATDINENQQMNLNFYKELFLIIEAISDEEIPSSLTKELITYLLKLFISKYDDNENVHRELENYFQIINSDGAIENRNNQTNFGSFQSDQNNVIQNSTNGTSTLVYPSQFLFQTSSDNVSENNYNSNSNSINRENRVITNDSFFVQVESCSENNTLPINSFRNQPESERNYLFDVDGEYTEETVTGDSTTTSRNDNEDFMNSYLLQQ